MKTQKPSKNLHPTDTQRLRNTLRTKKREKGVALVTVLAIVLLMTTLILSFFAMSTSELKSSQKDSENIRARSLADTAVNVVIGQIRQATTQLQSGDVRRPFLPWSSQPGAIRVFKEDGDLFKLYKLYSASSMTITGNNDSVGQDILKAWDSNPDEWVDMNAPIIIPDSKTPQIMDKAELYFPIVDPRAFRKTDSVEGFSYTNEVNGVVQPSGTPNLQRIPMPVRWLYITAGSGQGQEQLIPMIGGKVNGASDSNPIIGRIAFWTDDETCKINVNTASEGVFWDTPRTRSAHDIDFAKFPPVTGEYQRYPGHPATVCLSSVLFPNKRWFFGKSAPNQQFSGGYKELKEEEIQSIWNMSPFIFGDKGPDSSFGGTLTAEVLKKSVPSTGITSEEFAKKRIKPTPEIKKLYNAYDDYLFASASDAPRDATATTQPVVRERKTSDNDFESYRYKIDPTRLREGRFFLTTKSSAPEITLSGLPRICLWPVAATALAALPDNSGRTTFNPNLKTNRFSIFDLLIAFNCSLPEFRKLPRVPTNAYFYQRADPTSRHQEFYDQNDLRRDTNPIIRGEKTRNFTLYRYLLRMLKNDIPGFTYRSERAFRNFSLKYNDDGQDNFGDLAFTAGAMIDFIRNQNLSDPLLAVNSRYDSSGNMFGQITAICLCGGSNQHANEWGRVTNAGPKGYGRFVTVSEVALMFTKRRMVPNSGVLDLQQLAEITSVIGGYPTADVVSEEGGAGSKGTVSLAAITEAIRRLHFVDVGLLIEAFTPSQGLSDIRPKVLFQLAGGDTTDRDNVKISNNAINPPPGNSNNDNQVNPNLDQAKVGYRPFLWNVNGKPLRFPRAEPINFTLSDNEKNLGYPALNYNQHAFLPQRSYIKNQNNPANIRGRGSSRFASQGRIDYQFPSNSNQGLPDRYIAWGGNMGCRVLNYIPQFLPIVDNNPIQGINFTTSSSVSANAPHPRLIVYDDVGIGSNNGVNNYTSYKIDTGNLIQWIPLIFPNFNQNFGLASGISNNHGSIAERFDKIQTQKATNSNYTPISSDLIDFQRDIIKSLVPVHGDYRLVAAKRSVVTGTGPGKRFKNQNTTSISARVRPLFVPHPDYNTKRIACSFRDPNPQVNSDWVKSIYGASQNIFNPNSISGSSLPDNYKSGYFTNNMGIVYNEYNAPDFPWKLVPASSTGSAVDYSGINVGFVDDGITMQDNNPHLMFVGGLNGIPPNNSPLLRSITSAKDLHDYVNESRVGVAANLKLRKRFTPMETGDFDTGISYSPDGPYINRGDEGDFSALVSGNVPYWQNIAITNPGSRPNSSPFTFAPNRVINSAGVFGSIPTGVASDTPWNTLLLRPDPYYSDPSMKEEERHYGSISPKDHLMMDLFWMPIVQPYSISEPFETRGKINMNYEIYPFNYITRSTALHALFKSEMITAIPNNDSLTYKKQIGDVDNEYASSGPSPESAAKPYRLYINAEETLKQWQNRFNNEDTVISRDPARQKIKPGAFISASEICDMWLVPYKDNVKLKDMKKFWDNHRITGENLKEKPYANLYPRLTTRSNTYRVHVVAQSLRKVKGSPDDQFDSTRDVVTAEYRGSYLIERSISPNEVEIPDYAKRAASNQGLVNRDGLDRFYSYRITQVKQFVR